MNIEVREITVGGGHWQQYKAWRDQYIGVNPSDEPQYERLEDLRDACSFQMGFYADGALVGGVRLTPLGHGLTLGETLSLLPASWQSMRRYFDVNRLVVAEQVRGSSVFRAGLIKSFSSVAARSAAKGYIALCSPRLVPVYERVGATLLADELACPTIKGKVFSLIKLDLT